MQQSPLPSVANLLDSSVPVALQKNQLPLDQISIAIPYAVALFNKGYYWETHEVLEDQWMDEYGSSRVFLQGFIQAAAALYHVVAQNPSGYLRLSRLSREKLQKCATPSLGVDLSTCLCAFDLFDQCAQRDERFDLNHLPKITFAGIKI